MFKIEGIANLEKDPVDTFVKEYYSELVTFIQKIPPETNREWGKQIRMNNEVVDNDRLGLIVGMLFVWTGLFALSCIVLAVTMPNSDFESVVAVVASSLGNTGPLGESVATWNY